jgi:hypothetical protein
MLGVTLRLKTSEGFPRYRRIVRVCARARNVDNLDWPLDRDRSIDQGKMRKSSAP